MTDEEKESLRQIFIERGVSGKMLDRVVANSVYINDSADFGGDAVSMMAELFHQYQLLLNASLGIVSELEGHALNSSEFMEFLTGNLAFASHLNSVLDASQAGDNLIEMVATFSQKFIDLMDGFNILREMSEDDEVTDKALQDLIKQYNGGVPC